MTRTKIPLEHADTCLVANPACCTLCGYDSTKDRSLDITRAAMDSVRHNIPYSLRHDTPHAPANSVSVRKIVYWDRPGEESPIHLCTIFFVWSTYEALTQLFSKLGGIHVGSRNRSGIGIWVLGVREATDEELRAYHAKRFGW